MKLDRAGISMGKNSTKIVLFSRARVRSFALSGPVLGILVGLNVALQKAAHADNTLYLTGSQTTYVVNGQESFFVPGGACSNNIAPSPLCVDGGATLGIVGTGATVTSTAQVYVGFTTSGTSTLSIQGGGTLLLNRSVMQIGWSGGDGLVNVSGAGSQIVTSPESLLVVATGDNSNYGSPFIGTTNKTYGTLNITNGGGFWWVQWLLGCMVTA